MKFSSEIFIVVSLFVMTVLSAPAKEKSESVQNPSATISIKEQEKQLERLAKLAAQRLSHSIGVQKQKSFHYSNINGDEKSETKTEEKVVDPKSGDVVSDIKQDTKQNGGVPVTETKVNIPSENIDRTFIESKPKIDSSKSEKTDYSDAFQFTPIEVAKYLFQTGNFDELNGALSDLVNATIMTEKQAVEYKENVKEAYNQLVQSTVFTDNNEIPLYNVPSDNILPADNLPAYNYYNELLPYGGSDSQNMLSETEDGNGISELVNTLMDEWLTRTVLTGDRDAETMLSAIWDNVSGDDNPDDLGQMRDILVDIFTTEIIDGLTSDVRQEVPYYSDLLTNGGETKPVDTKTEIEDKKTENDKVDTKETDEDNKTEDQNSEETKEESDLKHLKM